MATYCATALGEGLAGVDFWLPQLAKVDKLHHVSLLSGLVWSAWHSDSSACRLQLRHAGVVGLTCSTGMVVGISFVFAWTARLKSGSVSTGMFLDASHTLWIRESSIR